ncbi:2-oxoacid:ferredoxin oxidoreductase subunit gamma [Tepiditoga spiralis]|uniref:2-oxoacid:ferredoxin oxidoreductase subunit gamma n=1 Tax=Tepiditoga spiralis TaxID=2108365 RepID=A0A7G1G4A3_9BACT|nr:2-oxoacid:acceptor oxidoreductase family protein [Tepiditoga spiralis]BBE30046.1 2-oxoacid:ferredoxin oxidoreductase subunit gamma [Tepiditoga spiralis]
MSYHGVIAAGFGGQGVMLFGQLLAFSGMMDNKFSTFLPSYGPEMRGGTANCTVVVSDEYIASPVIDTPNEVIAFNIPSMYKFEKDLVKDGILILNSSVIDREPTRKDIKVIKVPANEIAEKLGFLKVQNMVMFGAYLEATKAVSLDSIKHALEHKLTGKKAKFIDLNMQAIKAGMEAAKQ